jgi:hypothetical protein
MLARREEINTQLQVLIDGFLLAFSLWIAWMLRYYSTFWFNTPTRSTRFTIITGSS